VVGAVPQTPLGEPTALPQTLYLASCPLPKNLSPAVGLRPRNSALLTSGAPPPKKKDVGSMSYQNCYKGFHFNEKVEKNWSRVICLVCVVLFYTGMFG